MRALWLLAVPALLAGCEGEITGGVFEAPGRTAPVTPGVTTPPITTSKLLETVPRETRAGLLFSTLTWDLETELTSGSIPLVAAIDVRVTATGTELFNPRLALKPSATRQYAISELSVVVADVTSGAFASAFVIAESQGARVVKPGLIAVAPATGSLRLRFAASELTLAPVPFEPVAPEPLPTEPDAGAPAELVDGSTYVLRLACAGDEVLAVENGSLLENAAVISAPLTAGQLEQRFTITSHPSGGFNVNARHSGMGLNVPRGSLADGAALIQWLAADGAHPNQRWEPERQTDGSYRFRGVQSGLYVALAQGLAVQTAAADTCAQRFVLERME